MKNKYFRMGLMACTAVSVVSLQSGMAYAQDAATASATDLQTITVKTTKKTARQQFKKGAADTPVATETTAEEIQKKQITSFADLGRSTELGVNFNRSNGSVNIRGLDGDRVTTLIDGIRVPYLYDSVRSVSGGGDSFDFSSLSSVDVVRGSDSSRSGSGGLGGSVVLRTLEAEDVIGEGKNWGGIVKFAYDSANKSIAPSAAVAARHQGTSILFQGGYKRGHEMATNGSIDALSTARTKANPADFDQHNFLVKLKHDTETGHVFGVTAERFRRDYDADMRTSQSVAGNYRPNNYNNRELSERDRVSLNYDYESQSADSLIDRADATIYWQDTRRVVNPYGYRFTSVIGPYVRSNDYEEAGFGFNGTAQKEFDTGSLQHKVTIGAEAYLSKAEQYSAGVDSCPAPAPAVPGPVYPPAFAGCANLHTNQADMPDVDGARVGLYVQDRIEFADTGFSLTPGLRFDWYQQSPQPTPDYTSNALYVGLPAGSSDAAFSPKLLASYEVNPSLEFYAQWAMGFRSPNSSELYSIFGAPDTYLRLGNPKLQPETSNGFEVGAKFGDEDFGGKVNVFYNRYRNFITSVNLSNAEQIALGYDPAKYMFIQQAVNLSRVRIYGTEVDLHKQFDNGIRLHGALSWINGKDLQNNVPLNTVIPLKIATGIGYERESWGVDATWIVSSGAKGDTVRRANGTASDFRAPGYGIVDLTAWWEPEQVAGLRINAGIYNVFDKTYYDPLNAKGSMTQPDAYYSEPGRSFKVSLTKKF